MWFRGIETAKDGQQGLELFYKRERKPALILLHINMPVVDGHRMLERLRSSSDEHARTLPVVIMTGSTMPADLDLAYTLGANAYMNKARDCAVLPRGRLVDYPERSLRGMAVGRNNWSFLGSDRPGKRMASLRSFVDSCEMVKMDPFRSIRDVLSPPAKWSP